MGRMERAKSRKKKHRRRARLTKPKTAAELKKTERAIRIVDKVFREIHPFNRQEQDVAREIRQRIRRMGATLSFKPIVASGRNSSFVHHKPGRKIVREDELVIFDIGANYRGCCSDITRMHIPGIGVSGKGDGNGSRKAAKKAEKICRDALKIQKMVIEKVRPGVEFKELQGVYKKMMVKKGYKVRHLIGHGVGSVVHERVKGELQEGMVLTVEPGIYIKDFGGCRVEDMVLVKRGKAKVLSSFIQPLL